MADLEDILGAGETPAPETAVVENETETQAETEGEQPQSSEHETQMVPVSALQAERGKVKRYTEQVAEFQRQMAEQRQMIERLSQQLAPKPPEQPQQPTDYWDDPQGWTQQQLVQALTPIVQSMGGQREQLSQIQAVAQHGEETVNKAYEAMAELSRTNPEKVRDDYARIMQSPHPYGALVEWHRKQQVLAEVGTDPQAYKEKLKAELLAELQKQAPAPGAQNSPSAMPSNFATTRNVGTRSGPNWAGPSPIDDIFAKR